MNRRSILDVERYHEIFYDANQDAPGGEEVLRLLAFSASSLPSGPIGLFSAHEHGVNAPVTVHVAQLRDWGAAGPHLQGAPAMAYFNPPSFEPGVSFTIGTLAPQLLNA